MRFTFYVSVLLIATAAVLGASAAPLKAAKSMIPTKSSSSSSYSFEEYCKDFSKEYTCPVEHKKRKALFEAELASVISHNLAAENGHSLYKRGINKFSDLTLAEKRRSNTMASLEKKVGNGWSMPAYHQEQQNKKKKHEVDDVAVGSIRHSIDYRLTSPPVLTPVKDQGNCGSCSFWAANDAIESYTALKNGKLHVLSTQQLVSCSPEHNMTYIVEKHEEEHPPTGSPSDDLLEKKKTTKETKTETEYQFACQGYWPEVAIDFLVKNQAGEMWSEWQSPYTSYWDDYDEHHPLKPVPCMKDLHKRVGNSFTKVTSHQQLPPNDQHAILHHLSNVGPLITVMYVPSEFFSYESGIFDTPKCNGYPEMQPSHAIGLVGYGHDATLKQDYWILKNSWNADWGEDGFFRLLREKESACGFMPVPNEAKTELLNKTACGTCGIEAFNVWPTIGKTSGYYGGQQ